MKIVITEDLKDSYVKMIEEKITDVEVVKALTEEELSREIVDTEVLVTFKNDYLPELLPGANSLKWIQAWSAGVDSYLEEPIRGLLEEKDILLTNMSGVHGDIIAEHVMGLVISFSRKLHTFYQLQQEKVWERLKLDQLEGKKMTIVGTGSIGREVAHRAKAFKMKTIGIKHNVNDKVKDIDKLYSHRDLLKALQEADYVVAALPLTQKTEGIFDEKAFKAMKKTAYFINIARGKVVREKDLIEALKKEEIAGAGLDVFEKEPLSSTSPLYSLDNVLITPHVAGVFPDYNKKAIKIFLDNLNRYTRGQKLKNLVDFKKGY